MKKENNKNTLKKLLRYLIPFKKSFIIAIIFTSFLVIFNILGPISLGYISDSLKKDESIKIIIIFAIVMSIISILSSIIEYKQSLILQKSGQDIMFNLRQDIFSHIEYLSLKQLDSYKVGKLVSRVTNDTNAINNMYTNVIVNIIRNVLSILFIIIAMFIINWYLALIVLITTPILFIFSLIFRKISKKNYSKIRDSITNLNSFLSENISGIKLIQSFNQENKSFKEFKKITHELKKNNVKQIFIYALYYTSIYVLKMISIILLLYFGVREAIKGNGLVTYGKIIIIYNFIDMLFSPIQQIGEQFDFLQQAFTAGDRIFEVLEQEPLIKNNENSIDLKDIKGKLEFRHVWFKYNDNWILKDVSFIINPNETVALVGATGSGKTTIIQLLVRNYEIQQGEILLDDINIKDIKLESLRKSIGQMMQDVFLFNEDIKTNINLKDENIDINKIIESSKFVNCDKLINKLPNKYDEIVYERGNNFSLGERQLLSFARVISHDPKIMVLDEATANIDSETEVLIQDSLEKIKNIGTMIIIAHRLSTIKNADRIIYLSNGEIKEIGTHEELLQKRGFYYKLYITQYKET